MIHSLVLVDGPMAPCANIWESQQGHYCKPQHLKIIYLINNKIKQTKPN